MSTSPEHPRNSNFIRRQGNHPVPADPPEVSPLRGLVWIAFIGAGVALAVMYWETLWTLISEFVPLALEFVEEALDTLFELIGLSPAIAQMATAYTGMVLALALFYFLLRKSIKVTKKTRQTVTAYKVVYKDLGNQWYARKRAGVMQWWESLDWLHKIAVLCGLVLIGIPVALLLSFALGSLVTMLVV